MLKSHGGMTRPSSYINTNSNRLTRTPFNPTVSKHLICIPLLPSRGLPHTPFSHSPFFQYGQTNLEQFHQPPPLQHNAPLRNFL